MKIPKINMLKPIYIKIVIVLAVVIAIDMGFNGGLINSVFKTNDEVEQAVREMFDDRNEAIISGEVELIKAMYDTDTKYGTWAYEYEYRKVKYIHNWEQKQGVKFTEIKPTIVFRTIKDKGEKISINLICSTEYKYAYGDNPEELNSSRIGTYHIIDLIMKNDKWVIAKEWYKDPFADSLNLERIKVDDIKQYISLYLCSLIKMPDIDVHHSMSSIIFKNEHGLNNI